MTYIDPRWLEPNAVVAVDATTTAALVNALRATIKARHEEQHERNNDLNVMQHALDALSAVHPATMDCRDLVAALSARLEDLPSSAVEPSQT